MRTATPSQRRFVLAAKLRPRDPSPNWSLLSRLPEGTDPARFAAAVDATLHGNDSFTEVFDLTASGEIVVTPSPVREPCCVRDYPDLDAVRERVRELGDIAFDLSIAPLYHAEIAVVGARCYLVFVGAHVLCDGFGFYNLATDFAGYYADAEYVSPSTSSPVDTGEPYSADPDQVAEYYRRVFDGIDDLRVDGWDRRDGAGRISGGIVRYRLSPNAYRDAGALAKQLGVRRYSVLLTAFALTVHCLSGADPVVISTPMSNRRSGPQAHRTRGVRVNALPVRFDIAAGGVEELCRAADRQLASLIEYEQFAFSDFSRRLFATESVDAVHPSASFTVYPRPLAVVLDGIAGEPVPVDRRYIQYPLSVNIEVDADEATLIVERSDRLSGCDIGTLYETILRQLTGGLDDLGEIRWAEGESAASIPARVEFPERTLVEVFSDSDARYPDAIAAVDDTSEISYRRLDRLSDAIAAQLVSQIPEPAVGVHLAPSIRWLTTMLGVLKAGKVYVPIDPAAGPARFERIAQARAGLTIVSDTAEPGTAGARIIAPPDGAGAVVSRVPLPRPDDPAYLLFTSGTTGEPKGVQITHRAVARFFDGLREQVPIGDRRRWLLSHSPSFDISLAETFGALAGGGTVYIPAGQVKRDPVRLAHYLAEHRIEVLSQTPSAFTMLAPHIRRARSLAYVLLCGERLDFAPLAGFAADRPDVALVNCYGITETTVYHTAYRIPSNSVGVDHDSVIGRPFADVGTAVVDERLRVLPRGVPGQLVVSGAGVMAGYLGRDDLTAERIVSVRGVRSYLTGDRGFLRADGQFAVLGRMDRQVKIRGHRCELGEIEQAVHRSAAADQVHAMVLGSGLTAELVCFVALSATGTLDTIERTVRASLPRYLEPDGYVVLPELPVTTNGKVDAAALAAHRAAATEPVTENDSATGDLDVRAVVASVWSEVLGNADFDGSTRFFDAGGNSAMIIQVGERLRTRLGVSELEVVDLFEYCTPDSLAGFLAAKV